MFEGAWPFTVETPLATYVLEYQCHKAEVEVDMSSLRLERYHLLQQHLPPVFPRDNPCQGLFLV